MLDSIEAVFCSQVSCLRHMEDEGLYIESPAISILDHPSLSPSSVDLAVEPGFKQAFVPGYPANPEAPILEKDYECRNLREILLEASSPRIGKFGAFDYFGDGSFFFCCILQVYVSSPQIFLLRTTVFPKSFVSIFLPFYCHRSFPNAASSLSFIFRPITNPTFERSTPNFETYIVDNVSHPARHRSPLRPHTYDF